ncbi:serine hydrolase [Streptomyces montanus]|uniref:Serine hydrolase n=1 Tax=Streptomyces montanus TaxID=2580423 RepID=A0A5R9FW25_9ACTN|nr:serine hydrolase [Streptomyces montanus]TLS45558.1 serine hydrolase [Streptomyces montanus]
MDPQRARRPRACPSRRKPLLYAAVASVVLVSATGGGTANVRARAHGTTGLVSSSAASSADADADVGADVGASAPASDASRTPEAAVESVAAVPTPTVDRDALLAGTMDSVTVEDGAKVSVAVVDLDSGESSAYGDGTFETASIVKVDILAALLLRAQDADRELTAREKANATVMIKNSDNASATALWNEIGRAEGLAAANERLGLSETEGGNGPLWGLTQTTAADQLTLLGQVFGDESELSEASRTYLRGLMEDIAVDQQWGVSAAGSEFALKNGWLPRSTTGLWVINSIGRVTADGHAYLVAALSNGNSTMAKGVSLVESAAKAAVSSLRNPEV